MVLFSEKKCFRIEFATFWEPNPVIRDGFDGIKHLTNTHPKVIDGNKSLQFLVYFVSDKADADVGFYSPFREMKHRTHL